MIKIVVKSVQIIGIGDFKTKLLRKNVDEALKSHAGGVSITNVTEINQIKFYAITATPALSIDGQIVSQGEVPSVEDIRALFNDDPIRLPLEKVNTVTVACDFSTQNEYVLTYALYIAAQYGSSLEVVHILPLDSTPLVNLDFTDINLKKSALQKTLRVEVEKIIEKNKFENTTIGKIPVRYSVLNGQPARELILLSQQSELMILGTTGVAEHVFGSTAKITATGAHCPLIFVPNLYEYNGIARIVYGCTEKGLNKQAIGSICLFASQFGSVIDFIHVGADVEINGLNQKVESLLNEIEEKPRIGNFYFTDNKPVVKALEDYTSNFRPDLLVLEHNQSRLALESLFSDSLSEKAVAAHFSTPLLILYHSKNS